MKHLKTILGAVALTLALACTKNHEGDHGQVSFLVDGNFEIADQTRSKVSEFTALPSAGDFTITLTDASGTAVWTGLISEWDVATLLPAGLYTVAATYGDIEDEGFDKPYFAGSAEFEVLGKQSTPVSINVSLANTVIMVSCTDSFKNYYKDYSFSLQRDGRTLASFDKDDTRGAFIDGYKVSIYGSITGSGKTQTFTKDYTGLNEATAYTIVFDASNVGAGAITISFNNTVETVELGDLELND